MASDEELYLRHLEHVTTIINRMSQSSFTIRGWSVTLVTVILAIAGNSHMAALALALIAAAPTIMFWILDAYYVRHERLFRRLSMDIGRVIASRLARGASIELFDMDTTRYKGSVPDLFRSMLSPAVFAIPAMLAVVITVISITVR